jgi:hypothetical protein
MARSEMARELTGGVPLAGGKAPDSPGVRRTGWRLAIAVAIAAMECVVLQVRPAFAHTSTCTELLLSYVGKPLVNLLAERGPAMLSTYFTAKLQHSRQARVPDASENLVTLEDITNLKAIYRQNGRIDCDLRADLDSTRSTTSGHRYAHRRHNPSYGNPQESAPSGPIGMGAPPPEFEPAPPVTSAPSLVYLPSQSPAGGTAPPTPSAPPAPPPPSLGPAAPVTFSGGSVRKSIVTPNDPTPPAGFGLYVYVLPEREVNPSILRALEEFHRCLDAPGTADAPRTIALMILPVRSADSPRTDTALSHDFVRTAVPRDRIDDREVYLVATNQPLIRGIRAAPESVKVILLGRIAPMFIGNWLARLQSLIEEGQLESPAALALRVRSVMVEVNAIGTLIGIKPADAAPYNCT